MAKPISVTVKVPATTANLGPGFDCLGLAVDLWNEIEFKITGSSLQIEIEGEGSETLSRNHNNLVYRAMQALAKSASIDLPKDIQIRCKNEIPVSSGLGSSSAAVIAGLLGAKHLFNIMIGDLNLLKLALTFEGHADNISACLLGGLTIAVQSDGELIVEKQAIPTLKAIIALPDIVLSTHQARQLLPKNIPFKAGIFNIGRTALLISALINADYKYLGIAMQDQIHQTCRLNRIPGAKKAISDAMSNGAIGVALSGAGPSVIAFYENCGESNISKALENAFAIEAVPVRLFTTRTTNQPAFIIKK